MASNCCDNLGNNFSACLRFKKNNKPCYDVIITHKYNLYRMYPSQKTKLLKYTCIKFIRLYFIKVKNHCKPTYIYVQENSARFLRA